VLKTSNNIYKEEETTGRNFPLHERLVKKHDKTKTVYRYAEKARNAVIWLWSSYPLIELQKHLQIFLNSSMKNGREVLFRFYDPRVMSAFFNILQEHQAERFWNKINQCMFWDTRIGQYQLYERKEDEK